uniref:Myosin motor domain-containing protein n=1 Tax=Mesocestoides corti TaxID=53468 RepID=A0A5K3EV07_MESCO
ARRNFVYFNKTSARQRNIQANKLITKIAKSTESNAKRRLKIRLQVFHWQLYFAGFVPELPHYRLCARLNVQFSFQEFLVCYPSQPVSNDKMNGIYLKIQLLFLNLCI